MDDGRWTMEAMIELMPARRVVLLAVSVFAGALALQAAPAPPIAPAADAQGETTTRALVSAASKYVTKYQQEFAFLIADESYSQTRIDAGSKAQHRLLKSEFFLTYLPADNEWVAVRDVLDVDGTPVANREELRTLLAKGGEIRGLISQVIARNARYNIGSTTRNFNEPTLALLLVGDKRVNDVKFDRRGVEREGAATVATLAFEERGRPTLVRGPGGSLPAKGEITPRTRHGHRPQDHLRAGAPRRQSPAHDDLRARPEARSVAAGCIHRAVRIRGPHL